MPIHRNAAKTLVLLPRAAFLDMSLSLEAKGLLGYLYSKPDDWEINSSVVEKECGLDPIVMREMVGQLFLAGYLEVEPGTDGL